MELVGRIIYDDKDVEENDLLIITDSRDGDFNYKCAGYIFTEKAIDDTLIKDLKEKNIVFITGADKNRVKQGDVVEINTLKNTMKVLHRKDSSEGLLLVTNQCNNNCIMCPDPDAIREHRKNQDITKLKTLVDLMDENCSYICITGGEPTLLKNDLFELLDSCKRRFKHTEFLMLSNGRAFCYENYTKVFIKHSPTNIVVGIPVHSHKSEVHDYVTRADNSFNETIQGIKNLMKYKQLVEIRVVINKFNYKDLDKIAEYIALNLDNCYRVNFMAMEILGNALVNLEDVWIDFEEIKENLDKACMILLSHGIRANIYNMPLCYVDKKLWPITKKSITSYKVLYGEECEGCREKGKCGGFFFSTKRFKKLKGQRIV